jgi:K+-sensing histidine kinase KdpD
MSHPKADGGGRPYVERVRQDAQRYARELLADNERLRGLVLSLEADKRHLDEQLQAESRRFAEQFEEVERQNTNLANLYVASYQLVGTLDRERVLLVIQEILANLVGTEETAVFELDEAAGALELISSNGIEPRTFAVVARGQGVIGAVAESGRTWIVGDGAVAGAEQDLTACVPLKLEDRVTGVIAVFRLLPQKSGLAPVDRELFDLLGTHAAMALYCSGLHRRATGT